jgi:hypothetical protein
MLPMGPAPLSAVDRPVPTFITSGAWRPYVAGGRTLVPVPVSGDEYPEGMRWAAVAGLGFAVPGGYFIAPAGSGDRAAALGGTPRPTARRLSEAAGYQSAGVVSAADRAQALADLRYWRAGALVLAPAARARDMPAPPRDAALRDTVTELVGVQPQMTGGVWIWDVRSLTG